MEPTPKTKKAEAAAEAEALAVDVLEPETLSAEIARLRADLTALGDHVARIGRARATGLRAAAGKTAADGMASGEAALDDATAELQALEQQIADATRERPWRALGIAAGLGFLLSVLLRR